MAQFFNTFFYEPLYNGLIFLVSVLPGADIGIAVILLTLIVKFILLPFAHKSTKSQAKLRSIEPEVQKIKGKYAEDKQEQARRTMELYKQHGVNPFSGCLTLIVQLPVIFALYYVFWKGLRVDPELVATLPQLAGHINTALLSNGTLYSFVHAPEFIKTEFLGFIDLFGKSMLLAALAGISQYFQVKLAMPGGEKFSLTSTGSFKDDLAKSMTVQMRYILPVIVVVFAYSISAAVALYWTVSNTFSIVHELSVKRRALRLQENNLRANTAI